MPRVSVSNFLSTKNILGKKPYRTFSFFPSSWKSFLARSICWLVIVCVCVSGLDYPRLLFRWEIDCIVPLGLLTFWLGVCRCVNTDAWTLVSSSQDQGESRPAAVFFSLFFCFFISLLFKNISRVTYKMNHELKVFFGGFTSLSNKVILDSL